MEVFFNKISEKIWGKKYSIPFAWLIGAVIIVPFITNVLSADHISSTWKAVLIVIIFSCFFALEVWYVIYVYFKNRIKKAAKGKTGIVLFINAPDKKIYNETREKFGSEFSNNLIASFFEAIFVPYGVPNVEYRNREKIIKFLQRKRSVFYLLIDIACDNEGNATYYSVDFDASIIHRTYHPKIEKEYANIFNAVIHQSKDIDFKKLEMKKKLKAAASDISIECEYLIGTSLYFNYDFNHAEDILRVLFERIAGNQRWSNICDSIKLMRFVMFSWHAKESMQKYEKIESDVLKLEEMNYYLEKANECIKDSYLYHLNKAYYYIAHDLDSASAKVHVNICKQKKKTNNEWRYSYAFLMAYENKTVRTICSSYKTALKVQYNHLELIEFIEKILNREQNCYGLYLALGILYNHLGEKKLQKESINAYIMNTSDPDKIKAYLRGKKLYIDD